MSYICPQDLNVKAKEVFADLNNKQDSLKAKERMQIPLQEMPVLEPKQRGTNQEEVAIGFTKEQAMVEAMRCIQCKNKPCIKGCPVGLKIPDFICKIAEGDFQAAADIIQQDSLLPAICGRVCPQENQCQLYCTVGKSLKDIDKAVGIGRLERFVADWQRKNKTAVIPTIAKETGKKIAVIGSGPAGLVVSADCRRAGHDVTLFEAFHKLGGVMRYGIPEFRLPNDIVDYEIANLDKMGVKIVKNFVVGKTRTIEQLKSIDGFDAIFIGTGAGLPIFMGIEGENLIGVFAANEYLTRANLMRAYDTEHADTPMFKSKKVAVLGGGNVAMDASRMALRLGAEEVNVIYRRTIAEMPARKEEVAHAQEEGVNFLELQNVKRILGDKDSKVRALEIVCYELGEPDNSGRRRPVEIKNSEFEIEMDTVIVAIGNGSNPLVTQTTPKLKTDKRGNVIVDEAGATSIEGVFAGGDIVLGAATVILAMGEGRKAAKAINKYLKN